MKNITTQKKKGNKKQKNIEKNYKNEVKMIKPKQSKLKQIRKIMYYIMYN